MRILVLYASLGLVLSAAINAAPKNGAVETSPVLMKDGKVTLEAFTIHNIQEVHEKRYRKFQSVSWIPITVENLKLVSM